GQSAALQGLGARGDDAVGRGVLVAVVLVVAVLGGQLAFVAGQGQGLGQLADGWRGLGQWLRVADGRQDAGALWRGERSRHGFLLGCGPRGGNRSPDKRGRPDQAGPPPPATSHPRVAASKSRWGRAPLTGPAPPPIGTTATSGASSRSHFPGEGCPQV